VCVCGSSRRKKTCGPASASCAPITNPQRILQTNWPKMHLATHHTWSCFVFKPTMNRLSSTIGLFVLFSICAGAAEAYIVAPQSLTVEQLVTTPLATAGSGISLSIPETLSSYVNDPTFSITQIVPQKYHVCAIIVGNSVNWSCEATHF
jgi:hypothetical protein